VTERHGEQILSKHKEDEEGFKSLAVQSKVRETVASNSSEKEVTWGETLRGPLFNSAPPQEKWERGSGDLALRFERGYVADRTYLGKEIRLI